MTPSDPASVAVEATLRPDASSSVATLLLLVAGLVLVIVVWGAVVRLTGSGLSIPDWPLINGSLLPPFSDAGWQAVQEDYRQEALRIGKSAFPPDLSVTVFRTQFWIEYMHRAIAAIVGIVFLFAMIKAFRSPAVKEKVEGNFYLLAGLLVGQAGLGGVVVKGALQGVMIAIHLIVAYIFLAVLLWTTLRLVSEAPLPEGGSRSAGLIPLRMAWITAGLVLLQVFIGGLVAGDAKANLVTTWPLMFGGFIPPHELLWNTQFSGISNLILNPIFTQFTHRWMPVILLIAFGAFRMTTARVPLARKTRIAVRTVDALFGLQLMVGITNVMFGAQTHVSALHSAVALALFGAMVVVLHDLRYASGEAALGQKASS